MRKFYFVIATALVAFPFSFGHAQGTGPSNTIARFEVLASGTNFLTMDIELFDHDRPETVKNFLMYVRSGAYSNLVLQRLVTNFVIQAGGVRQKNPRSKAPFISYTPVTTFGAITNEFSFGPRITNGFGTIAMARIAGQTNSANSEWFFNLVDNPFLDGVDGGYTVFGHVINTVNERTGTNALAYFNTLLSQIKIVLTFSPLAGFEMPVIYEADRNPNINEVFYFRISILNDESRDRTRPKLTIATPVASSITTMSNLVEIAGTATDDRNLLRVIAAQNGAPWELATGTSTWNFMARLNPGTNRLTLATLDTWGNQSDSGARTIYYQAPSPVSLETLGSGSIVGAMNGQPLNLGYGYTITAQPAAGYYFAGWRTGTGTNLEPREHTSASMNPKRSFLMSEGYSVTAEFVPLQAPVSITINGSGKISGTTNGQVLTLGRTYTVTAKPDPGNFFIGWRGGFRTNNLTALSIYPRLAFHMLPDLLLIADFIPNIFPALKGTYNGVFTQAGAAPRNSGWLTLNLGQNRNFSGRLEPLGSSFRIRGAFDVYGRAFISGRLGTNLLVLSLRLQTNGTEQIIGTYFDGATDSEVVMYRAPKFSNAPPQAGQYTFVIPGTITNSSGSIVEGDGVGTVTIDSVGKIIMAGTLADGTDISQTTTLLAGGHWPLLGKAYDDGGLIGMMTFFTNGVAGFDGDVKWINPGLAVPLKESTRVIGSGYTPPSTEHPLFNWSAGVAELSGGDFPMELAVTEDLTVQANGAFQITSGTTNLQLTLAPGTGIITGNFVHPAAANVTLLKAAVLQNSNNAAGFFISGGQSGGIKIDVK